MIAQAEIRRLAGALGIAMNVVEHDYVLGCYLHYLALDKQVQSSWVFKGGTALAKCYFEDYRFSEDLDFSATTSVTESTLFNMINDAKATMQENLGIITDVQESVVETIEDEYGKESFEAKIYYRGPMLAGGSPRSIRVHIKRDETIFFPPEVRNIFHSYSDKQMLPKQSIPVYSLEEVFVEKLRAFSGQRLQAISRDIFDLFFLKKQGVDVSKAYEAFPSKLKVKGIEPDGLDFDRVRARKEEYRSNWENNFEYLIPQEKKMDFETAWDAALELLQFALKKDA